MSNRRLVSALILIAVALAAGAPRLAAHPAAATEVILTVLAHGQFELTLATDEETLLTKLEAQALVDTPPAGGAAITNDERLARRERILCDQLDLYFDAERAPLKLAGISRPPDRPGRIAVRFSGHLPPGSKTVIWRTTFVYGSYPFVLRTGGADSTREVYEWLNGSERSSPLAIETQAPGRVIQLWRFLVLGFAHILPKGLDHVLFVLSLFLLARNVRTVLLQVTAFTVAHSVTIGLALYGVVSVPTGIVEPLIALSIAYVAVENLLTSALKPWRLALVFLFGLLHGLGFADALMTLQLPRSDFLLTLAGFNVGVELGQLAVILLATLAVVVMQPTEVAYRRIIARPASMLIALFGIFWAVERSL